MDQIIKHPWGIMPIRFSTSFFITSKHSCLFLNNKKPKGCGLFLNTFACFCWEVELWQANLRNKFPRSSCGFTLSNPVITTQKGLDYNGFSKGKMSTLIFPQNIHWIQIVRTKMYGKRNLSKGVSECTSEK